MIRVTKLTDYGIGLMAHLAGHQAGHLATAPDLSDGLKLPLPTVRKILKILARENLLTSQRGAAGGYSLARPPREITLMDMVVALEGTMALTECAGSEPCACEREDVCNLKDNWNSVNGLIQNTLKSYTLDQMAGRMRPWDLAAKNIKNMQNNLQGLG